MYVSHACYWVHMKSEDGIASSRTEVGMGVSHHVGARKIIPAFQGPIHVFNL